MKPSLYTETTIISYLTAWPGRDIVAAARQRLRQEWWEHERERYDLIVSEAVVAEAAREDASAAELRLAALAGIHEVKLTEDAAALAEDLLHPGPISQN